MNTNTLTTSNPFTTNLCRVSTRFPKAAGDRQITETTYTVTREGHICGGVFITDTTSGARLIRVTLRDLEVRVWEGRLDYCGNPKTGRTLTPTSARVEIARQVLASAGLGSWLT